MSRANYHWSRTGDLHPGVDPDTCPTCEEHELTVLAALATPPTQSQETA